MKRILILLGLVFSMILFVQGESSAQRLHDRIIAEHQKKQNDIQKNSAVDKPEEVKTSESIVESAVDKQEVILDQGHTPTEVEKPAVVNAEQAIRITSSLATTSEMNNKLPHPMTYEEAALHQEKYSEDITLHRYTEKDIDGNKKKLRIFDFLKSEGLSHSGNTLVGVADRTSLRLAISYGFEGNSTKPIAYIAWSADLAGNPDHGYKPNYIRIVFESGYIRELPLQGWQYQAELIRGVFVNSWGHCFWGSINLSDIDIYDILQHGNIVAVYVDDGNNNPRHFFYSGDKDTRNKTIFVRGFQHIAKILDVNNDTIQGELADQKANAEKERKAKLRVEIQKEINDEKEREAMKKEILAEMEKKQTI